MKLQQIRNAFGSISPHSPGISTKKNVAMNASKDFGGSHLWGNSSIPFGGTLPSRGAHGKCTHLSRCKLFVMFPVPHFLFPLNVRDKHNPWWLHAVVLQEGPSLRWSPKTSGTFGGIDGIEWEATTKFLIWLNLKVCFRSCFYSPVTPTLDYATWQSGRSPLNTAANASTVNKCPTGSLPRPPVHTIHGRTDWSAKYGHH